MKKTLVLGDIHGRFIWKQIVEQEQPDRVIFIGDYFDSFDISGIEQIHNFKEIINYKLNNPNVEVIMLVGNHDYHYIPGIDENYSGYQAKLAPSIAQVLEENKQHLQMAYKMGEYLFTHAGVSSAFMDNVFENEWNIDNMVDLLNDQFKYKPRTFMFGAMVSYKKLSFLDSYGDNTEQSPIWIRPRSLMSANYDTLRKQVVQVVGHTQVKKIDVDGKSTGNRYWFIDCLDTSGQYMIIDDKGEVSIRS